jgi:chromosome segregation ATPase
MPDIERSSVDRAWDENPPASYRPPTETEKLRAEVERIRSEYKLLERDYQQAASERAQASEDALRLREDNAAKDDLIEIITEREQDAVDEVERLRERIERVEAYARKCAMLRMEPSTQGLKEALRDG